MAFPDLTDTVALTTDRHSDFFRFICGNNNKVPSGVSQALHHRLCAGRIFLYFLITPALYAVRAATLRPDIFRTSAENRPPFGRAANAKHLRRGASARSCVYFHAERTASIVSIILIISLCGISGHSVLPLFIAFMQERT